MNVIKVFILCQNGSFCFAIGNITERSVTWKCLAHIQICLSAQIEILEFTDELEQR